MDDIPGFQYLFPLKTRPWISPGAGDKGSWKASGFYAICWVNSFHEEFYGISLHFFYYMLNLIYKDVDYNKLLNIKNIKCYSEYLDNIGGKDND